jgi:hypothetical protein
VEIFAVADANANGTPSGAQLAAIEEVFTQVEKNILWATDLLPNGDKRIEAFASPLDTYEVVIREGVPALSASMKTAIESALDNYALTRNPYIKGLSLLDQGTLEAVALSAVCQNTIDSNPDETGKIIGVSLLKDDVSADYYTLDPGHRAQITVSYE